MKQILDIIKVIIILTILIILITIDIKIGELVNGLQENTLDSITLPPPIDYT